MLKPFYDFVRNASDYGLGYVAGRYYSAYPGKVVTEDDLKDEQGQNRIKVTCQPVTHRSEALSQYAYPVSPYAGKDKGFIFPPDEGDALWITFDEGKPDIPRYLGSWWCNDDAQNSPKNPNKSFLPTEFRPAADKRPTARGFKTKLGHGFLMEDDVDAELGHRVEIWSGEQTEPGADAEKHHKLEFNDKDLFVQVNSYGKEGDSEDERWQHILRFDDKDEFVQVKSAGASTSEFHKVRLDDKDEFIRVESTKKHYVLIDDKDTAIEVMTAGGFFTKWDEQGKKIETSTAGGNKLMMDDNAMSNELLTASGQSIKQEQAGTTINEPVGKVDVIATSASTHAYAASLTRTIGGAFTDTVAQALSVTIGQAATWIGQAFTWTGTTFTFLGTTFAATVASATITAANVTIASPSVLAGSGSNQPLVNAAGLAKYNAHFHLVVGPFPGFAQPTPVIMIPAVDTTVALLGA